MPSRIVIDSNILIEYFRAVRKQETTYAKLCLNYNELYIPAVVQFEVLVGIHENHRQLWNEIIEETMIIPLHTEIIETAVWIFQDLKRKNKSIDLADLFIAATALANDLPLATSNKKHFERIEELKLV